MASKTKRIGVRMAQAIPSLVNFNPEEGAQTLSIFKDKVLGIPFSHEINSQRSQFAENFSSAFQTTVKSSPQSTIEFQASRIHSYRNTIEQGVPEGSP